LAGLDNGRVVRFLRHFDDALHLRTMPRGSTTKAARAGNLSSSIKTPQALPN
jgi:hypothetical protein